jgi:hypothetical protein
MLRQKEHEKVKIKMNKRENCRNKKLNHTNENTINVRSYMKVSFVFMDTMYKLFEFLNMRTIKILKCLCVLTLSV